MTDLRTTFGKELERELSKIGFDLGGHYPLLETMFYTLDVDFDSPKVGIWYGPEQEKIASCKLSASDVVMKLHRHHKMITEHDFTDETFIRTLHGIVGEKSSIPDIITEYAAQTPYGIKTKKTIRTFLSYDLYRLKTRIVGDMELSLVAATRAYTQRKADFLWIPTNEHGQGMYISHIRFRKIHPRASTIRADIDAAVKVRSQ